jgi:hypothetical protein
MPVLSFSESIADINFLSGEECQLGLESVVWIESLPFGFQGLLVEHAGDFELHAASPLYPYNSRYLSAVNRFF